MQYIDSQMTEIVRLECRLGLGIQLSAVSHFTSLSPYRIILIDDVSYLILYDPQPLKS